MLPVRTGVTGATTFGTDVVVVALELLDEDDDSEEVGGGATGTGAGGVTCPENDVKVTPAGRSAAMRCIMVCQATSVDSAESAFDCSAVIWVCRSRIGCSAPNSDVARAICSCAASRFAFALERLCCVKNVSPPMP